MRKYDCGVPGQGGHLADPLRYLRQMATHTLVDLLKKDEEKIARIRLSLGDMFVKPLRPLANSCTLVKLACNYALMAVKADIAAVTGRQSSQLVAKEGASRCNRPYK